IRGFCLQWVFTRPGSKARITAAQPCCPLHPMSGLARTPGQIASRLMSDVIQRLLQLKLRRCRCTSRLATLPAKKKLLLVGPITCDVGVGQLRLDRSTSIGTGRCSAEAGFGRQSLVAARCKLGSNAAVLSPKRPR